MSIMRSETDVLITYALNLVLVHRRNLVHDDPG